MQLHHCYFTLLVAIVASQTKVSSLLEQGLNELPKPRIKESMGPIRDKMSETSLFPRFQMAAYSQGDCESSLAPVDQWHRSWFNQIDRQDYDLVELLVDHYEIDILAYAYKFLFDQSEEGEYFGKHGKYTDEQIIRYEQLEYFWELTDSEEEEEGSAVDISTNHTVLMGAHGSILADRNALRLLFDAFFVLSSNEIEDHIDFFQSTVEKVFPLGYDFPLLTANAIAIDSEDQSKKDAVVIGDGLLEMFEVLGLNNVGSDFVLAHEFSHQIQFELLTKDGLDMSTTENYRDFELMADFLAGYFLGHALGGNFTAEEIDDVTEAAFFLGDCYTTADDHHGTPQQRKCVTDWATSMARAQGSSTVSKATDLVNEFHRMLPKILVVDKSACPFQAISSTPQLSSAAIMWKSFIYKMTELGVVVWMLLL